VSYLVFGTPELPPSPIGLKVKTYEQQVSGHDKANTGGGNKTARNA